MLFANLKKLGNLLLRLFVVLRVLVFSAWTSCGAEYVIKGTVTSETHFYDKDGNVRAPDPAAQPASDCDFLFSRSGEKWRLDIVYPDPTFPVGAVRRTIIPTADGGLFSVISFPPRPGVTNDPNN